MSLSLGYLKRYGYTPGGGLLSPDGKYFLLLIPKNASTFLSKCLASPHNGWRHSNTSHIKNDVKQIVFLKDPVDRWLSGFATYVSLNLFGFGYGSDHFIEDYKKSVLPEKIISTQMMFDDHTFPQVYFTAQLNLDCETIYLDLNKEDMFKRLYRTTGFDVVVTDNTVNNSKESNYDVENIHNFFKERLDERSAFVPARNHATTTDAEPFISLRDRIYEVYKADYILAKQANIKYGT